MRTPPYWMLRYIHSRVAQRAEVVRNLVEWEVELNKSEELIQIELRDRQTEKIGVAQLKKLRLDRLVL